MAGEDVCTTQRDDAESDGGVEGDALEDFVEGAIATAGEEDVGVELGGLAARGVGAFGGHGCDVEALLAEGCCDALDDGEAVTAVAGVRVVEERGPAHVPV